MFTCGFERSNFSLLIFVCPRLRNAGSSPLLLPARYCERFCNYLEPAMRFELMTSSLPRRRSTPELRGRRVRQVVNLPVRSSESQPGQVSDLSDTNWSGRRDSNSRPSAWKADALPTELHPPINLRIAKFGLRNIRFAACFSNSKSAIRNPKSSLVQGVGFEPT